MLSLVIAMLFLVKRLNTERVNLLLKKMCRYVFRFGTRDEAMGYTTLAHCNDFNIDEKGMKYAVEAFVYYVMKHGGCSNELKRQNVAGFKP